MNRYECIVKIKDTVRVDKYISEVINLLNRSRLKALDAHFFIGDKEIKPSRKLKNGERLIVIWKNEESQKFIPQSIPLDIIYENDSLIVVNKPQGMVTHPAHGNWKNTLANALLGRLELERGLGQQQSNSEWLDGSFRAGIVHRLDKDTSGVIICAKNWNAQEFLSMQFRERKVTKEYLAIVKGQPPKNSGCLKNRIGRDPKDRKKIAVLDYENDKTRGKIALTIWKVIKHFDEYTLMLLKPMTGRTHQLRVQMKWLGCSILGDPIYSKKDKNYPDASLMLHAWRLKILLPGQQESKIFTAEIPFRFKEILKSFKE